jgi:uncharacterized protein YllA (UPF0747 family)
MSLPRVLTEPLGGSPLSRAMQRGEVAGIGESWPRDADAWKARVREVRGRFGDSRWLERLAPALGQSATLPALVRAASDGVVVTTGQQAALFGGPLLTLVKALSARAFADAIERATGVPCATIFWAATDDADFAEAASVMIPQTGGARALSVPATQPAGTPMSKVPLRDVEPLLDAMAGVAGSAGEQGIEALRRHYRDGVTLGDAYLAFMRELLAPWGIAVLDASHPALLESARPTVATALQRSGAVEKSLADWTASLERSGFRPQVESVPGLSLVFANEGSTKRRVPVAEAAEIGGSKLPLSPNVLLRPIVEAAILPTVAYVAGPGEIAYFAQVPPIADAIGAARPIAVPRWSTTIVEPSIDRILERYGVAGEELRDFDVLLTRLVRARMPVGLAAPLGDLRRAIDAATTALEQEAAVHRVDPRIVEGLRAQLGLRLDRGDRRITAALKRNEAELRRDLGTARGSLYPEGIRQERSLSFVPFVARYGDALIERMLAEAARHAHATVGSAPAAAVDAR